MRNLFVAALVIGVGGYFGAKFFIQHKAEQDLDGLLEQARPFVDVEYERVVATMKGELRAEGLTIRIVQFDDAFTIDSVGLQTPGFLYLLGFDRRELEWPESLGVEIRGMRTDPDADFMRKLDEYETARSAAVMAADSAPADRCIGASGLTPLSLKELGYHELVVDFDVRFHREEQHLVLEFGTHVEDAYALDVAVTLANLADPTALARGAQPLLVKGRLDYTDHSLNARILKHCADQQVAPEDVIAAQLREIQAVARESGMELDAMITDPYTEFLRGKRRFTLTSAPTRPVDLTTVSLYKPSDVPNLLNLMAEAG
jgi:hypothetical protein